MTLTHTQINTRPSGALVAQVRERTGYTQLQCASIVATLPRTWQRYEALDESMPLVTWWCFLLRIEEIQLSQLPPVPPRHRFAKSPENQAA